MCSAAVMCGVIYFAAVLTVDHTNVDLETIEALYENVSITSPL